MHSTAAAYKTGHICHSQSNYIAATHNTTHSPCTSTCTTHPALPSPLAFHNPPICTQLTQGRVGKMAQAVEMVKVLWCHSHLAWLVLRVPSRHVLVFILKTFDSLRSNSATQLPAITTAGSILLNQGFICHMTPCSTFDPPSLVPRPLPDFISQP